MLFDLEGYRLRKLDPEQGTKPLDFGGGGINGSINLDGRFIAINSYHPEHGIVTLTSVPPFPDADRYDQAKVRAYRKSLVTNEGFGLAFEQDIIEREYYLIEDAVPFLRFTLADGTIAECVTNSSKFAKQEWRFSNSDVSAKFSGNLWVMRSAYTQLTEGGILFMPSTVTTIDNWTSNLKLVLANEKIDSYAMISGLGELQTNNTSYGSVSVEQHLQLDENLDFIVQVAHDKRNLLMHYDENLKLQALDITSKAELDTHIIKSRATVYANICAVKTGYHETALLTDHMILPLSWNRDAFYTALVLPNLWLQINQYANWVHDQTWRGTFCKTLKSPIPDAWGRSYMANGQQKDSRAFQLDQQIFPLLLIAYLFDFSKVETFDEDNWTEQELFQTFTPHIKRAFKVIERSRHHITGLYTTDETPADDDIPLSLHFSTHILLWYTLKRINQVLPQLPDYPLNYLESWISILSEQIAENFITEHNGKQIYSYATDGEGNHYIYHDANDIPLVMMPLWGFCDKDDPIWRNTIDFAFSDANPGFYDGVLGSVHTPAPWALGDAQELIFCKVIGDRDRYQRVWERVEKAAQWDGALPEAYDAQTYEVVSRHWFAWPNAMVAIADGISWDWETEGEYAR